MNEREIRDVVVETLGEIVPELDPATLAHNQPFRDQLDIDSMDFLNFLVAVDQKLGVEIPEADYGRLQTVDSLVAYLTRSP
jgi:acyl carrier protein